MVISISTKSALIRFVSFPLDGARRILTRGNGG
jgi:hypothetical protein